MVTVEQIKAALNERLDMYERWEREDPGDTLLVARRSGQIDTVKSILSEIERLEAENG